MSRAPAFPLPEPHERPEVVLERWAPDARSLRFWHVASGARIAALVASVSWPVVALATFGAVVGFQFRVILMSLGIAGVVLALVFLPMRRLLRDLLRASFVLTSTHVRAGFLGETREIALGDIAQIAVVRVRRRKGNVGHVVFRAAGDPSDMRLAIPANIRISGGTVGFASWGSVQQEDPRDSFREGALTFWFVPNPEAVRERIEAAMRGVSPHARGPHR